MWCDVDSSGDRSIPSHSNSESNWNHDGGESSISETQSLAIFILPAPGLTVYETRTTPDYQIWETQNLAAIRHLNIIRLVMVTIAGITWIGSDFSSLKNVVFCFFLFLSTSASRNYPSSIRYPSSFPHFLFVPSSIQSLGGDCFREFHCISTITFIRVLYLKLIGLFTKEGGWIWWNFNAKNFIIGSGSTPSCVNYIEFWMMGNKGCELNDIELSHVEKTVESAVHFAGRCVF
jgi:hypothetical protein